MTAFLACCFLSCFFYSSFAFRLMTFLAPFFPILTYFSTFLTTFGAAAFLFLFSTISFFFFPADAGSFLVAVLFLLDLETSSLPPLAFLAVRLDCFDFVDCFLFPPFFIALVLA